MQEVTGSTPVSSTTFKAPSNEGAFFVIAAYVNILFSESRNQHYIGASANLCDRILRHNRGYSKSTASGRPWLLMFTKAFPTFQEARAFEAHLKKQKRSSAYLHLMANYIANPFPLP